MTKKLFAACKGKCVIEGVDAVMMQECLLGGHLYLQVVKEKISSWLNNVRFSILKRAKTVNNYTTKPREYSNKFIPMNKIYDSLLKILME